MTSCRDNVPSLLNNPVLRVNDPCAAEGMETVLVFKGESREHYAVSSLITHLNTFSHRGQLWARVRWFGDSLGICWILWTTTKASDRPTFTGWLTELICDTSVGIWKGERVKIDYRETRETRSVLWMNWKEIDHMSSAGGFLQTNNSSVITKSPPTTL